MKTTNPTVAIASAGLALLLVAFLWLIPFDIPATQSWISADWLKQYALTLWLPIWLLVCVVRGHILSFSSLPGARRAVAYTRYNLMDYGGGFYGIIGVVMFLNLELTRLWQAIPEVISFEGSWLKAFVFWFVDFGIDSIMNGIYAFVWPVFHAKAFPDHFWPAIAVAAGIYYGATWLFGDHSRRTSRSPNDSDPDTIDP